MRAREPLHLSHRADMVPVPVRGEQQLDIRELETELLDVRAYGRDRVVDAGVDQDASGGCRDQIDAEIIGSDVIQVGRNAHGRKRFDVIRFRHRRGFVSRLRADVQRHRGEKCSDCCEQPGLKAHASVLSGERDTED